MYRRHVRQWELFSCLSNISCEVIIAFLLPSTLGAKCCLVPDLQNERKQRTLRAGKWVFAHSSGTDPWASFLLHHGYVQGRWELGLSLALSRALGTHVLEAWKLTGSPFSRGGSKGAIHCKLFVSNIPMEWRWEYPRSPFWHHVLPERGLQAALLCLQPPSLHSFQVCLYPFLKRTLIIS